MFFKVLQCVCKTCSRILMKPEMARQFRERVRKRDMPYLVKKSMKKKVLDSNWVSSSPDYIVQ